VTHNLASTDKVDVIDSSRGLGSNKLPGCDVTLRIRLTDPAATSSYFHLQNAGSRCDAGVTQSNGVGRKLGFRLLENRLARETEKRADHTPFPPKVRELTFLRNHREAIAASSQKT
jgi:hypothetical protein